LGGNFGAPHGTLKASPMPHRHFQGLVCKRVNTHALYDDQFLFNVVRTINLEIFTLTPATVI